MDPLTGLFLFAIYKGAEKFSDKLLDAAWKPVAENLEPVFKDLAGQDSAAELRKAIASAGQAAYTQTLENAPDKETTQKILASLTAEGNREMATALAEEAAKLVNSNSQLNIGRLANICDRHLRLEALFSDSEAPSHDVVVQTLSIYIINLREALLDQESYHYLLAKDQRNLLKQLLAEHRPAIVDDEPTYRQQVQAIEGRLDFLGLAIAGERPSVSIRDLYIPLRSKRQRSRRSSLPLEVEKPGSEMETEGKERDVLEAFKEHRKIMLLGDPGSGKTTLLKYLAEQAADPIADTVFSEPDHPLPVFVALRKFSSELRQRNQDYSLLSYFYTQARERYQIQPEKGFFEAALEAGQALVLLDGLDEVWEPGQRVTVRDAVRALVSRYPNNLYLVTSRISGYESAPLDDQTFPHYTLLSLDNETIKTYVTKWYALREPDAHKRDHSIANLLGAIEREQPIRDLAGNPLLLAIIAMVHRNEATLPHERVTLYEKCVETLLENWENLKELSFEDRRRPFYEYRLELLERLAYDLHSQSGQSRELRSIAAADLEIKIADYLVDKQLVSVDNRRMARREARRFIRLTCDRTGLLIERGQDEFSFPHLTFQEYLAARDIAERTWEKDILVALEEIAMPRLHDPHWREVILLLIGILGKIGRGGTSSELVGRLLDAAQDDPFEEVTHRSLFLVGSALADRVVVKPLMRNRIINNLLEVARSRPVWEADDAIQQLMRLETEQLVLDGLLELARNPRCNAKLRCSAATALGHLGQADAAMGILLNLASDSQVDAEVQMYAASALGVLGQSKTATGILYEIARNPQVHQTVRRMVTYFLAQLGQTDATVLSKLLELACDSQIDIWERILTISVLGQYGQQNAAIFRGLLKLAFDPIHDTLIRGFAISSLGQLGHKDAAVLSNLLELARNPNVEYWLRSSAAEALSWLGQTDDAVDILIELVHDTEVEPHVRISAISALGRFGDMDTVASNLLELASDPQEDARVRISAGEALGQHGLSAVVRDILLELARDPLVDASWRRSAAYFVGQLSQADTAATILLELVYDPQVDADVRSLAVENLGWIEPIDTTLLSTILTTLLDLACDPHVDTDMRCSAISALGWFDQKDTPILSCLLALARDPHVDAEVRRNAYVLLK